ncbi:dephospho-CoA kinase [uncultured Enterococcus sp.]|uniref:dephospho-CoA kinase n=1 Tax=uncultured Enterococcus sp. TaxID=167972 RepID=UPI0025FDDC19|nr:dephospho-CoA kinase [uncultured Enterococcus sp.]
MTIVLGITGGIACGKTTVVTYLNQQGIPVIDGDVIARKVVEKGQVGLTQLVTAFGPTILTKEGKLDRAHLGSLVFADQTKREQMNQILGPIIRKAILAAIDQYKKQRVPLVLVDIPLLYEHHYEQYMTKVLVVSVSPATQLTRLMKRNGYSQAEALARIESQWPLSKKIEKADILVDNEGSIYDTHRQLDQILANLQQFDDKTL